MKHAVMLTNRTLYPYLLQVDKEAEEMLGKANQANGGSRGRNRNYEEYRSARLGRQDEQHQEPSNRDRDRGAYQTTDIRSFRTARKIIFRQRAIRSLLFLLFKKQRMLILPNKRYSTGSFICGAGDARCRKPCGQSAVLRTIQCD